MSSGEVVVRIVDSGLESERVIVERTDPYVWASVELVHGWARGSRHIRLYGDGQVVEFGTAGEGLGRVRYRVGDITSNLNPADRWGGLGWSKYDFDHGVYELTRIDDAEWASAHALREDQ